MKYLLNLLTVDQDHSTIDLEKKSNKVRIRNVLNLLFLDQDNFSVDLEKKRNYIKITNQFNFCRSRSFQR